MSTPPELTAAVALDLPVRCLLRALLLAAPLLLVPALQAFPIQVDASGVDVDDDEPVAVADRL